MKLVCTNYTNKFFDGYNSLQTGYKETHTYFLKIIIKCRILCQKFYIYRVRYSCRQRHEKYYICGSVVYRGDEKCVTLGGVDAPHFFTLLYFTFTLLYFTFTFLHSASSSCLIITPIPCIPIKSNFSFSFSQIFCISLDALIAKNPRKNHFFEQLST